MQSTRSEQWLYSAGSLASALTMATFSGFVNFYYIDYLKLSPIFVGQVLFFYGLYNAINDPLLGQLSDTYNSKHGTRTPFIKYGILPFVIAFALLWLPEATSFGGSTLTLSIYFIFAIFLFDGLYTLVFINYTALYPEIYKTSQERNRVSAKRQIFGIIGNIIGYATPPLLAALMGWSLTGIIFAAISGVFIWFSILGVKSFKPHAKTDSRSALSFKEAVKETLKNIPFIWYVIASFFLQFTFVFMQAVLPFYVKYVLKADSLQQSLVLGTVFISALLFVFGWSKISTKRGAKWTVLVCIIVFGISLIPYLFAQTFYVGILIAATNGIGLAGLMILIDVLLADVIDLDHLKTGKRREGMYYGMNALIIRLGISVQGPLLGYILNRSGYVADSIVQVPSAITGLKVALVIVPIIALICSFLFFTFYPLGKKEVEEIKIALK
ncbi:MAG: MFS transporter [Firmicutes bacterium]|nr:MFS transporter [Bacillota bacterium]MDD4264543.1 MFS transporter [Bacillota bacterium]MDD4694537.1 MFS transporter [Bacillota bacterium]